MASNSPVLAEKVRDQAEHPTTGPSLIERIRGTRGEIATALPRQVDPDRFIRLVVTTCRTNPKLMDCAFDSIMGAVMQSAQLGLEPGPLGHAYFIPFYNRKTQRTECQYIIGYTGYLELFRHAGVSVIARTVRENDQWSFYFDETGDHFHHVPAEGNRGPAVRFYAVATLPSGQRLLHVMSRSDVDSRRERSRSKDDGPWVTDYEAMALKTVVRDLARWVPKSVEVVDALGADYQSIRYQPDRELLVTDTGDQPAIEASSDDYEDPDLHGDNEPKESLL